MQSYKYCSIFKRLFDDLVVPGDNFPTNRDRICSIFSNFAAKIMNQQLVT